MTHKISKEDLQGYCLSDVIALSTKYKKRLVVSYDLHTVAFTIFAKKGVARNIEKTFDDLDSAIEFYNTL